MAKAAETKPVKTGGKEMPVPAGQEMSPIYRLRDEVDQLFNDFFRSFWRDPFSSRMFDIEPLRRFGAPFGAVLPHVDMSETPTALEISAELPGLDEKDIELVMSDGVLTLKGEKKEEREEQAKDHYVSERRYGAFQRSFTVPDTVDEDKISAAFDKGVLTVTLPKMPKAAKAQKRIAIGKK
jgi:HSP20 family protein